MKTLKILTTVLAFAALALFTTPLIMTDAWADDVPETPAPTIGENTGPGSNFIDEDGDGICDNLRSGKRHGHTNGNETPEANFVDEDGDGVCDNAGEGCLQKCSCCDGTPCDNFVDEDGDGVCDNKATGKSSGDGLGKGRDK